MCLCKYFFFQISSKIDFFLYRAFSQDKKTEVITVKVERLPSKVEIRTVKTEKKSTTLEDLLISEGLMSVPKLAKKARQAEFLRPEKQQLHKAEAALFSSNQAREPPPKKAKYNDDSDSAVEELYKSSSRAIRRTKNKTLKMKRRKHGAERETAEPPTGETISLSRNLVENPAPTQEKKCHEKNQETTPESVPQREPTSYEEDAVNPLSAQRIYYRQPEEHRGKSDMYKNASAVRAIFEKYLHGVSERGSDFCHIRSVFSGSPQQTGPIYANPYLDQVFEVIEPWTRAQEERELLRQPVGAERPCVNDEQCEGTKIPGAVKIVLREACTFREVREFMEKGTWPEGRRPCRMCARKAANADCYNFRANGQVVKAKGLLHTFCNLVNTEGEYAIEDVMMSSSTKHFGLFGPVPIHCRLWYRQYQDDDGVYHYDQPGYTKPTADSKAVFRHLPVSDPAKS